MAQGYGMLCWERLDPGNPEVLAKHSGCLLSVEFSLNSLSQDLDKKKNSWAKCRCPASRLSQAPLWSCCLNKYACNTNVFAEFVWFFVSWNVLL